MRVLLLGPERPRLEAFMSSLGDEVFRTESKLESVPELLDEAEFVVSYGYRFMIRPPVLAQLPSRVINLHISLLPWNKGADPNLWSFLEDTPKGVTIHLVDEGLDTGAILAQQEVAYEPGDTLRSTYLRLSEAIEELFIASWPMIRTGELTPQPQPVGGTIHRLADKEPYTHLLHQGWDTPVSHLLGKAVLKSGG